MLQLILGIKRGTFRDGDRGSARADAELAAKRPAVLARQEYRCRGCGYESKPDGLRKKASFLDVHHQDDDHRNNQDDNLVCACHTCHPYQHIGELSMRTDTPIASEGLGRKTILASIAEVPARDVNLLQRALGVALLDPAEEPFARKIIEALAQRGDRVREEFGTLHPRDFAAAMQQLNADEYAERADAISDVRLLFNVETLKVLGTEMMQDYPTLPVKTWGSVAQGVARKSMGSQPVSDDTSVR